MKDIIMDDIKLSDNIKIIDIRRHEKDPHNVDCRATIEVTMPVRIDYVLFTKGAGKQYNGRLPGRSSKIGAKTNYFYSTILQNPATKEFSPSFTREIEIALAKAISSNFEGEQQQLETAVQESIAAEEKEEKHNEYTE